MSENYTLLLIKGYSRLNYGIPLDCYVWCIHPCISYGSNISGRNAFGTSRQL